ncbi:MAG TPA: hypothetical protein PKH07_14700, partial [bacterium]|nr:hypothetical protein [bacterium]
ILSTTPPNSQKLTTGDTYSLSALASCLSNEDGLRLLWTLRNNGGAFQTKPMEFLSQSSEWQEKVTTFSSVVIPNNGPVVLKAQIVNASPTPTVLAEDSVIFQIATPTRTPTPTPTLSTGVNVWTDYK